MHTTNTPRGRVAGGAQRHFVVIDYREVIGRAECGGVAVLRLLLDSPLRRATLAKFILI